MLCSPRALGPEVDTGGERFGLAMLWRAWAQEWRRGDGGVAASGAGGGGGRGAAELRVCMFWAR